MAPVDPSAYPIDTERYRAADPRWLDELDQLAVHSGLPHQRMGTRAIDEADWFRIDEHRTAELALRRRLLNDAADEVFLALDGSEAACAEAADTVHRWLLTYRPDLLGDWDPAVTHPLQRAGLAMQDDLCIMQPQDGAWVLTAALLCFPTYWRLADKAGLAQEAVHGPVPHFAEDLAVKVNRFFDRLGPERIVTRRNWGFSAHPLLFVPDLDAVHTAEGDPAPYRSDLVWLRSERQTLRKLPRSGAVLFAIRVQLAPATALLGRPDLAARLLDAMQGWSPELVESRGGRHGWVAEVSAFLRTIVAGRPRPG
ncbi:MAG: DUF3445 domain-containing protein [Acidimicrobiales bacterium]|nr:DUF3445 domain-containing protein [Acidimicrobiales bacterium]